MKCKSLDFMFLDYNVNLSVVKRILDVVNYVYLVKKTEGKIDKIYVVTRDSLLQMLSKSK